MPATVSTHLTFTGAAEEAIDFHVSLWDGSEIVEIERYGSGDGSTEGTAP